MMDADALRSKLGAMLRCSKNEHLVALTEGVTSTACWGSLARWLSHTCREDADLRALMPMLRECDDARAWLVFLGEARSHPSLLDALMQSAPGLPRTVQCALVSLHEAEGLLASLAPEACAAAHAIASSAHERASARAVYEAHIASLQAMRWGAAPPEAT
jgi:hypothetical protein